MSVGINKNRESKHWAPVGAILGARLSHHTGSSQLLCREGLFTVLKLKLKKHKQKFPGPHDLEGVNPGSFLP